jgi:hypothetical protein
MEPVQPPHFWRRCWRDAAKGSLSRANATATIVGGLILWIATLWLGGLKIEAPTSVAGTIGFAAILAAASLVVSWLVVFAWRLIGAPTRVYKSAQEEIRKLSAELAELRHASFEILYDPHDSRFVRSLNGGFRYFICLHILADRSVRSPNIRALESEFTERVFAPKHHPRDRAYFHGPVQIYSGGQLDPDDREFIELCDLPAREYLDTLELRRGDNPLRRTQRFILEARGEHARVVRVEFEYNPHQTPMIRMLP